MRLEGANQIAEVFFNEQWVPICGHWFCDNDIGASLFCQKLGYDAGAIKRDSNNNLIKFDLQSDGLTVGKCDDGDQLLQCTDTWPDDCNALVVVICDTFIAVLAAIYGILVCTVCTRE